MSTPSGAHTVTATDSDFAPSELPLSDFEDACKEEKGLGYPPYAMYETEPAPPSVADAITAGREVRRMCKMTPSKKPAKPSPPPAKPRHPKATDVKLSPKQYRAHARCLRRHAAVLTDRLEFLSKPPKRAVIYLWREHANHLPAETIVRLRNMLDADTTFKPDQAYEYFINLRKTKRLKMKKARGGRKKQDLLEMCAERRFAWARNATVAFARGIQQRLARPGSYALAEKELRLSDIILEEMCHTMSVKKPCRYCLTHCKSKFLVEMADKVAVWIDDIMVDADDRMLMMDGDEDAEVREAIEAGDDDMPDEFSSVITSGSSSRRGRRGHFEPGPALEKLLEEMNLVSSEGLYQYTKPGGKRVYRTYDEAAEELKEAKDWRITHDAPCLSKAIKAKLTTLMESNTPPEMALDMAETIRAAARYLSQRAVDESTGTGEFTHGPDDGGAGGGGGGPDGADGGGGPGSGGPGSGGPGSGGPGSGGPGSGGPGSGGPGSGRPGSGGPGSGGPGAGGPGAGGAGGPGGAGGSGGPGGTGGPGGARGLGGAGGTSGAGGLGGAGGPGGAEGPGGLGPKGSGGLGPGGGLKSESSAGKGPGDDKSDSTGGRAGSRGGLESSGVSTSGTGATGSDRTGGTGGTSGRRSTDRGGVPPGNVPTSDTAGGVGGTTPPGAGVGTDDTKGAGKSTDGGDFDGKHKVMESDSKTKRLNKGGDGYAGLSAYDPSLLEILHKNLKAHGAEVFHKQNQNELSHSKGSEWLHDPPRVDRSVKETADTVRLAKKFEKKLKALVEKETPPHLADEMQDLIIEAAQILAETFVSKGYQSLVREALISEMQKRGNEILVEVGGAAESCFFAAQRLKTADVREKDPRSQVAHTIMRKLEDVIRCRTMARKLAGTLRDHAKSASEYLSDVVTKPDEKIEAYVALLEEMEGAGDALLVEEGIKKSYVDSAGYLRQLTTHEDQIHRPNTTLQSTVESKLKSLMSHVEPRGYTASVMSSVITDHTKLLVSYLMLQAEKTKALEVIVNTMDKEGDNVILRHGAIRKSFKDAVNLLHGKNADQIKLNTWEAPDPVVLRKINIKLTNLMTDFPPSPAPPLLDETMEEATAYLAFSLLQARVIKVCRCMKNVFVQCEIWCDDMLRKLSRPCCTCSRTLDVEKLSDLLPSGPKLRLSPCSTRAFWPGHELTLTDCPAGRPPSTDPCKPTPTVCPSSEPSEGCPRSGTNTTTSYLLYETRYDFPERQRACPPRKPTKISSSMRIPPYSYYSDTLGTIGSPSPLTETTSFSRAAPVENTSNIDDTESLRGLQAKSSYHTNESSQSFHTPRNGSDSPESNYERPLTILTATVPRNRPAYCSLSRNSRGNIHNIRDNISSHRGNLSSPSQSILETDESMSEDRSSYYINYLNSITENKGRVRFKDACPTRSEDDYSSAPIVSTEDMSDWHALMVSLMWNVQGWRNWIQENIDKALDYRRLDNMPKGNADEPWKSYCRKISTEALQWRQYNNFSRQLSQRLASRYNDKRIVSPSRITVRTGIYVQCHQDMTKVIEMFSKWSRWLLAVVKESYMIKQPPHIRMSLHEARSNYFKNKVEASLDDWKAYNDYLRVGWEDKYKVILSEWLPTWKWEGPVWVMSACGAVPSGAVAAGVFDGEDIWIARTTHKCTVLPGALHPSKHSCLVYADGEVHQYTRYQVMCNARVAWMAWRAGTVFSRAVRVAAGVHLGRVLYRGSHLVGPVRAPRHRCHVVIFGRQFAFSCYELLVLAENEIAPSDTSEYTHAQSL